MDTLHIFVHNVSLVMLMDKTGYNITEENKEWKIGPLPLWTGPPPPKGSEIFIAKLPSDVYEDELFPLCEQFGKIYEFRSMIEYDNNEGYAFVTYTNNDDATKAMKNLDGFKMRPGQYIRVYKSIDNCQLFIYGIPKDKSEEEINEEINRYTEGVTKVNLYGDIKDKYKNRGFAFIEYETHRAAAIAKHKLLANKIKLFDNDIAVDWAIPKSLVEKETMKWA